MHRWFQTQRSPSTWRRSAPQVSPAQLHRTKPSISRGSRRCKPSIVGSSLSPARSLGKGEDRRLLSVRSLTLYSVTRVCQLAVNEARLSPSALLKLLSWRYKKTNSELTESAVTSGEWINPFISASSIKTASWRKSRLSSAVFLLKIRANFVFTL